MSNEDIELQRICEGASELSVDDLPEEEVIFDVSSDHDEDDIHRSLSLSDISSLNASTSTISQSEVSRVFKKLPRLNLAFKKVWQPDSRRAEVTCLGCQEVKNTNEVIRFVKHVKKCLILDQEIKDAVIEEYKEVLLKEGIHGTLSEKLLAKMILENNLPFSFVGSQSFIQYMRMYDKEFNPPSRTQISNFAIPRLSGDVERSFQRKAKSKNGTLFSVEFDAWNDMNRWHIWAAVATMMDGNRFLIGMKDTSFEQDTAENIVKTLKELLLSVPKESINAIISDSAGNCKKARELLVKEPGFTCILQHRCVPHWLNRVGQLFSGKHPIKQSLTWATNLASMILRVANLLKKFKKAKKRRVKRACPVRWYSYADMIDTLIDVKELLIAEAPQQVPKMHDMILENSKWSTISEVSKVLRPLADCIAQCERKDGSLGEAMKHILELAKLWFSSDLYDPIIREAIVSLVTYFSRKKLKNEIGIWLAAYLLDRRNDSRYLTEKAKDLALDALIRVASTMGTKPKALEKTLVGEFSEYCLKSGEYRARADSRETAIEYWTIHSDSGVFSKVAMRFAQLRSSSANIERTFSTMRYVQGLWRLNLDLETLTHLTRCRINKSDGLKETIEENEELPILDNEYIDSDSEEEEVQRFQPFQGVEGNERVEENEEVEGNDDSGAFVMDARSVADIPSYFSQLEERAAVQEFLELIDFSIISPQVIVEEELHNIVPDIPALIRASQELRGAR